MEIGRYIGGSPWSRLRQREALRNLDDRLLSDIGLSRGQVLSGGTMMRTAVDVRDARVRRHALRAGNLRPPCAARAGELRGRCVPPSQRWSAAARPCWRSACPISWPSWTAAS